MFCLKCDVDHRYLHSFPTRRSSDLILRQRLFEQFDTVILTSATLTVGGRFDYIRQRLGLDQAKERKLPPEFDYPSQALLYLPRKMPEVRDPGFAAKAADEIVQLLENSHGRAF